MAHLELMIEAAIAAGEVISEVYEQAFSHQLKGDGSPVTEADARAEEAILVYLARTGIPVLAEESAAAGRIPDLGRKCFIVDPLDGTREFVKRNGEFTVNIALVEDFAPVSGVVLAPVTGALFVGSSEGAFEAKVEGGKRSALTPIRVRDATPPRVVASRSHGHGPLAALVETMQLGENVSVGSSLKFCLLARGDAQLYPRFTPTSEWDTAAGQAVLEAAGGAVLTPDGKPLRYGKSGTGYLNSWFVAAASLDLALTAAREMSALADRALTVR